MLEQREAAKAMYIEQKKYWRIKGEELNERLLVLRNQDFLAKSGLNYDKFHLRATLAVIEFLGAEVDPENLHFKVPGILEAMGIGTQKFGYNTGFSGSEKTGDYILSQLLPLPQQEEEIDEEEPIIPEEELAGTDPIIPEETGNTF